MMSLLEQALQYAANGLSVIPVARTKKPLLSWISYCDRRANEEEIRGWFAKWPDMNIGLVTGPISGIAVVDVEKGGDFGIWPATLTTKTGGGGRHFIYKWHDGIKNDARILPLTDIRGWHGYIVAPPSLHASGERYEVLSRVPPTEFPDHMFKAEEPKQLTLPKNPFASPPTPIQPTQRDWTVMESGAPEGQRNATAAQVAGKLMRQIHPNEWSSIAWPAFEGWNQKNSPPLEPGELLAVWNSISKKAVNDARYEPQQQRQEKQAPKPVGEISWTEVLNEGERELKATVAKDFLGYGYNFLDDALTGIPPGDLVFVGAAPGTGKSSLVMSIVHRAAAKGHKSFVFALEDSTSDYGMKSLFYKINSIAREETGSFTDVYSWNMYRKNCYVDDAFLKRMAQAKKELANDNVAFAVVDGRMNFASLEKVIDEQIAKGTELFVIDHLGYFEMGDDKMRNLELEKFCVDLRHMQRRNRARIIVVCHLRKLNGELPTLDSFGGSSAMAQNATTAILLFRDRGGSLSNKKRAGDNVTKTLTQQRDRSADRFVDTYIIIPKTRNPNGENTLVVKWDRVKGEYVDTQAKEMRPMSEFHIPRTAIGGEAPTAPMALDKPVEPLVDVKDFKW